MPIRTAENSTGIYRTITRKIEWEDGAKLPQTKRDLNNLRELIDFFGDVNIHAHLDGLEKGAKKIIKEHGGFPGLRTRKSRLAKGDRTEWFPLPPDAPPVATRARDLIFEIWSLRQDLKKLEASNPELAAQLRAIAYGAYVVGRRTEVVRVSAFEPAVRTGAERRRILAHARQFLKEERENEHQKWQAKANELRAKNRRVSWTRICDEARKDFPTGRIDDQGNHCVVSLRAFQMNAKDPLKKRAKRSDLPKPQ
jgi:hypothetical protein